MERPWEDKTGQARGREREGETGKCNILVLLSIRYEAVALEAEVAAYGLSPSTPPSVVMMDRLL